MNECCKQPANLSVTETRQDVVVKTCTCGKRHITLTARPGNFFAKGSDI